MPRDKSGELRQGYANIPEELEEIRKFVQQKAFAERKCGR